MQTTIEINGDSFLLHELGFGARQGFLRYVAERYLAECRRELAVLRRQRTVEEIVQMISDPLATEAPRMRESTRAAIRLLRDGATIARRSPAEWIAALEAGRTA